MNLNHKGIDMSGCHKPIDKHENKCRCVICLAEMIDELYKKLDYWLENGIKRIAKLESDHLGQELDPKVWVFVHEMLDKLQSQVNMLELRIIETRVQFIDQLGRDKKPHICPVCKGSGRVYLKSKQEQVFNNCETVHCTPCEGKGIIWE